MDPQEAGPLIEQFRVFNNALVHFSDGNRFFKVPARAARAYFIFGRPDFALAGLRQ